MLNTKLQITQILRLVIPFSFVLLFFSAFLNTALAATLQITPSTGSYNAGQTFSTTVKVQPGGKSINAVETTLKFDPALLSVVSVGKDGSAFSLWTVEPTFSNSAGTINFGGGSPTPFSATSNLVTVTFRAVSAGTADVTFTGSSVLAADGKGTDVYESATPGKFTIAAASATPPPAPTPTPTPEPAPASETEDEAIIFGDPPRSPEIGSQVFLDPEVWYKSTEGLFTWTLPFDINAVAVEISSSDENEPNLNKEAVFDPPIDEFAITKDIIQDGEQFVSIRFKNQVGWGVTANRKLLIDTTPPERFDIKIRTGTTPSSFPLLVFEASDKTSGIDYYELTIADNEPLRITPDEAKLGYLLKELEDGTYTAKIVAFDKAGNSQVSTKPVLITAGWIKPAAEVEDKSFWDFLTPTFLFILFLIIIIILLGIYIWYERKRTKIKEEKLRRETREVQDQMEKIFSALRDEIYDQVNTITKRKRLSKNEKEAVEELNQALEVSETLIEKEINDVKSVLK